VISNTTLIITSLYATLVRASPMHSWQIIHVLANGGAFHEACTMSRFFENKLIQCKAGNPNFKWFFWYYYPLKDQPCILGNITFGGTYMWVEIFMFLAQTLIDGVDKEYFSCALNFKTFENTSQKLWPNMYFVSQLM